MRNSAVKTPRKQSNGTDAEYIKLGQASTDEEWERAPARIKVVGVGGGGGCNTVRRMMQHNVRGVQYVMCNTDIKSLEQAGRSEGLRLIQLGPKSTKGRGRRRTANAG
ncbi:MAG: hypothetical protein EXR46_10535 [Dehalococcoidia bacterium]|nr:hypothetical protein [Dehalococcoidia bacterium]